MPVPTEDTGPAEGARGPRRTTGRDLRQVLEGRGGPRVSLRKTYVVTHGGSGLGPAEGQKRSVDDGGPPMRPAEVLRYDLREVDEVRTCSEVGAGLE